MSKFKSLIIREAVTLGNTGNVRLRFKGLSDSFITIKPMSALLNSLSPSRKVLCQLDPSNLVGATLSVESIVPRDGGDTVEAIIETFKKGDKYIATENNTAVKEGKAKVGDTLECESDGLRIQGGIRITLHAEVEQAIVAEERIQAVQLAMRTVATTSRASGGVNARITDNGGPDDESENDNTNSEENNGGGESTPTDDKIAEGITGTQA